MTSVSSKVYKDEELKPSYYKPPQRLKKTVGEMAYERATGKTITYSAAREKHLADSLEGRRELAVKKRRMRVVVILFFLGLFAMYYFTP
jgi:hypothetical protein